MAKANHRSRSIHRKPSRPRWVVLAAAIALIGLAIGGLYLYPRLVPVGAGPSAPNGGQGTSSQATSTTTAEDEEAVLTPAQVSLLSSSLSARQAVLYDLTRGHQIFGKNENSPCYPASLTKLLTAAVVLEHCQPDTVFTVGSELSLVDRYSSTAGLRQGYKMTVRSLLHGLLLSSGGDAAYTLAVNVARQVHPNIPMNDWEAATAFCALMNEKAASLGATNSHFMNPDGIHNDYHVTTPRDMLLICQYALTFPEIREICAKAQQQDTIVSGQQLTFRNTNQMLSPNQQQYYPYANGLKTGFTNQAGHCLAATATKDGRQLLALVFGCPTSEQRYADVATLFNAQFNPSALPTTALPTAASPSTQAPTQPAA